MLPSIYFEDIVDRIRNSQELETPYKECSRSTRRPMDKAWYEWQITEPNHEAVFVCTWLILWRCTSQWKVSLRHLRGVTSTQLAIKLTRLLLLSYARYFNIFPADNVGYPKSPFISRKLEKWVYLYFFAPILFYFRYLHANFQVDLKGSYTTSFIYDKTSAPVSYRLFLLLLP